METHPSFRGFRLLLSAHTLQQIMTGLRKLTTATQGNLTREKLQV